MLTDYTQNPPWTLFLIRYTVAINIHLNEFVLHLGMGVLINSFFLLPTLDF